MTRRTFYYILIFALAASGCSNKMNLGRMLLSEQKPRTYQMGGGQTFADVPPSSIYFSYVQTISNLGVTTGCGQDANGNPLFCPDSPVQKQQMAVFLLKSLFGNNYLPPVPSGIFSDVPLTNSFVSWVEDAFNKGFLSDCGGGNFCPADPVTRQWMAEDLLKAEQGAAYLPPPASGIFPDVPKTSPFAPWVEELSNEGITGGCGNGYFCPTMLVTRGQTAIFAVKTFNLVWPIPLPVPSPTPPLNSCATGTYSCVAVPTAGGANHSSCQTTSDNCCNLGVPGTTSPQSAYGYFFGGGRFPYACEYPNPTPTPIQLPTTIAGASCTYYASQTGGGDGSSPSSTFQISNFWSVVHPGDVLCLLDGTYTGANSMINPPINISGIQSAPITVRALNDGQVLINGQSTLTPIYLHFNDWFVIEGINAANSIGYVVNTVETANNVFRRVIAWNAKIDTNSDIMAANHSLNILFEDVAAFGTGRKVFTCTQFGNTCTFRRAWGEWDGSTFTGPKMVYSLEYNNYDMTIENSIGTWAGRMMPSSYQLVCPPEQNPPADCGQTFTQVEEAYGVFAHDGMYPEYSTHVHSKLLGSIAYQIAGETPNWAIPWHMFLYEKDTMTLQDIASFMTPGAFASNNADITSSPVGSHAGNVTLIGGGSGQSANTITSAWTPTNVLQGPDLSVYQPGETLYNNTHGAEICYRYVNGTLTNQPLWPWPMNQRILDATAAAGFANPVDVNSTIQSEFGAFPAECSN